MAINHYSRIFIKITSLFLASTFKTFQSRRYYLLKPQIAENESWPLFVNSPTAASKPIHRR